MSQHQIPINDLVRRAAAQLQTQTPPPALQARVRDAAQAAWAQRAASTGTSAAQTARLPERALGWRLPAWGAAGALAAILLGTALLMLSPPIAPTPQVAGAQSAFVRLVPPDRWPADTSAAWLVSTELPGERLAALGLPFDPARAGERLRAELLVVPSGDVLAVRLLP